MFFSLLRIGCAICQMKVTRARFVNVLCVVVCFETILVVILLNFFVFFLFSIPSKPLSESETDHTDRDACGARRRDGLHETDAMQVLSLGNKGGARRSRHVLATHSPHCDDIRHLSATRHAWFARVRRPQSRHSRYV